VLCLKSWRRSGPGTGQLQENGLGRCVLVRFRVLEWQEGKLVPGQWHPQPRGQGDTAAGPDGGPSRKAAGGPGAVAAPRGDLLSQRLERNG
jgi:hypothetical protein